MGSRRDEALQVVDSFTSSIRSQLSDALAQSQQHADPTGRRPSSTSRLADRLSRALDLPPPSASSSAPQTARPSASNRLSVARPVIGRPTSEVPFSNAGSHSSVPLESSSAAQPTPANPSSYRSFADSSHHARSLAVPNLEDADELPSYSRRAPIPSYLLSSLPPKRLHKLASKSGKLELEVRARGREHVVLIQEIPDADTNLEGCLKVVLKEPEGITHVRVRVKGIIRTMVMQAQSSGRHPLTDELVFLSSSRTLWTSTPSNGSAPERLPGNKSTDPTKLHGTFLFPFSLPVPGKITHLPPSSDLLGIGVSEGDPLPRPIRPPPSFMLDSRPTTGGFEASCRYYLKVTVGRKGLFKLNERFIVPIVFVPRQPAPTYSPLRELAVREGRRRPTSMEDPEGWTEEGKYVVRENVRRGAWKTKTRWVEVEGKVVKGKVSRGTGEKVEFEVQILSSNPEGTGRFCASSVAVTLVQRVTVSAQQLTNAVDIPVARATSVHALGSSKGESVQLSGRDGSETGWKIGFRGSIRLPQAVGSSFSVPNLAVTYLLCITVSIPTSTFTLSTSAPLTSLALPIEIVSCAPRPPALLPPPPPATSTPPPLPVAEASQAPFVPNLQLGSPPPLLPPRKDELGTAQSSLAATPSSTPAVAVVDEDAERRMEEEWGMPPSYFEVAEEGSRSGRRG
ncbi:hypothetical protein JCM11641_003842 [Rhodosporidiobolus odoratus]